MVLNIICIEYDGIEYDVEYDVEYDGIDDGIDDVEYYMY
ncbi:MAG: hypothetical protein [Bacteriophage sp.]|nr:MAG: hypothetical protein [Bacteriophage sp.]